MAEKKNEPKVNSELLIFKIEKNPKVNNAYKFLGAYDTMKKALEGINNLSANETGRIVILEKKAYYDRKPAITLNTLNENIITE